MDVCMYAYIKVGAKLAGLKMLRKWCLCLTNQICLILRVIYVLSQKSQKTRFYIFFITFIDELTCI